MSRFLHRWRRLAALALLATVLAPSPVALRCPMRTLRTADHACCQTQGWSGLADCCSGSTCQRDDPAVSRRDRPASLILERPWPTGLLAGPTIAVALVVLGPFPNPVASPSVLRI